MGIKFLCPDCGRKLNVKSFLAGKKGICPHCTARFRIPNDESQVATSDGPREIEESASEGGAATTVAAPAAVAAPQYQIQPTSATAEPAPAGPSVEGSVRGSLTPPIEITPAGVKPQAEQPQVPVAVPTPEATDPPAGISDPVTDAPNAVWYVRPPAGGQFGPAAAEVMRKWLAEGRVGPDSLVWREGWSEWKVASEIFIQLRRQSPPDPHAEAVQPAAGPVHPTMMAAEERPGSSRPAPRKKNSNAVMVTVILLGVISVGLVVALFVILNR